MNNVRLPKCIMHLELVSSERFKDCVDIVWYKMGIGNNWEISAENITD